MWMQQISAREKLTAYEGNAAAYRARVNPPGDHDHEEVGRHGWCASGLHPAATAARGADQFPPLFWWQL